MKLSSLFTTTEKRKFSGAIETLASFKNKLKNDEFNEILDKLNLIYVSQGEAYEIEGEDEDYELMKIKKNGKTHVYLVKKHVSAPAPPEPKKTVTRKRKTK